MPVVDGEGIVEVLLGDQVLVDLATFLTLDLDSKHTSGVVGEKVLLDLVVDEVDSDTPVNTVPDFEHMLDL